MVEFLIVVHTLVSIMLIIVVLMQSGQGGLNSMMGGTATSMLGSSGANDFITKLTKWLGIIFIALALLIGMIISRDNATVNEEKGSIIDKKNAELIDTGAAPVGNEYQLPSSVSEEESKEQ